MPQHVTALYLKYLGRAPGASETDYWVAQLGSTATDEDIVTGFAGSVEFILKHSLRSTAVPISWAANCFVLERGSVTGLGRPISSGNSGESLPELESPNPH
jgi:Domain of unknown function (DUF4214)